MLVDPADLPPLDRSRAVDLLGRIRLERVEDPDGPAFAAAYAMLADAFADSGELEPREALQGFVRTGTVDVHQADLDATYHLVGAWHGDTLIAVRDCYVDVDLRDGRCLVSLAHVFVAPAWRRTGLAALLRALPVTLGRRRVDALLGRPVPTLVIAEMEPADPDDPDTVVRLLAYGRSGFRALDPRRLPYSQPEFRELSGPSHTAIPLIGVGRVLNVDGNGVPVALAELFPRLFHACHRLYLPAQRVDPSERHALCALRTSTDPVALLALPTRPEELDLLAPLVRGAVLPLYPSSLRGPDPTFADPGDELRRLHLP